jgi:hypothetical protein
VSNREIRINYFAPGFVFSDGAIVGPTGHMNVTFVGAGPGGADLTVGQNFRSSVNENAAPPIRDAGGDRHVPAVRCLQRA